MNSKIRIGTRESDLAVWQARQVESLLSAHGCSSELVFIKSEGDIDLKTPLYEMGVQGIFTRSLDSALLNKQIDIAVHSMKDVPTKLPIGLSQAAVLKRGNYKDLFVFGDSNELIELKDHPPTTIATSSIRRKAQWLNRFPGDRIENLRGNVNTRMRKVAESKWAGAIFAAAGLERIGLRPKNAIELDWMLPAPAQGAIIVVCREEDKSTIEVCGKFNDVETALCTSIERYFLRELQGGCSTPISALALIKGRQVNFQGSILSPDGTKKIEINRTIEQEKALEWGKVIGQELLSTRKKEIEAMIGYE